MALRPQNPDETDHDRGDAEHDAGDGKQAALATLTTNPSHDETDHTQNQADQRQIGGYRGKDQADDRDHETDGGDDADRTGRRGIHGADRTSRPAGTLRRMSEAVLFYLPGAGSFAPHVLLEETGVEHGLVRVVRDENSVPIEPADYLHLNPSGRIPTLVWPDGTVQTESAAICLALAERAERDSLIPAIGSSARIEVLARLMFLTNTVQVAVLRARYPQRFADDDAGKAAVADRGNRDLLELRDRCAAWYAGGTPFIRGAEPGVDDLFLGMLIRWTRLTDAPWWDDALLDCFYDRFHALPSVTRAREQEDFEPRPPAGT